MKKDNLSFKSNAKLKDFSIDDIGKLSINDLKKLKEMFGPKPRQTTKKRKEFNDNDNIPNIPSNGVRSSSEHMKGYADTLRQSQYNPFFRGYKSNSNNPLLIMDATAGDNSRFSNKSNLNIDDVNKAFQNNMSPLLDNIRTENKNILLNEFMPYLENFKKNTTTLFDSNFKNIDRDIRDLYSEFQDPVDSNYRVQSPLDTPTNVESLLYSY